MKKLIIVFVILILTCLLVDAATPDLVMIAHKDVPDTSLTQNDIQDIYLGKKTKWGDNSEIKPAQLKSGDLHDTGPADWQAWPQGQKDP